MLIKTTALLLVLTACKVTGQLNEARERKTMVRNQLLERGISNPSILKAMEKVPRHLFVPKLLRSQAYSDHPLPIGMQQTISQPYIVALMTELVNPDKNKIILEVGTGSGYQAAVISTLVKHVYTVEIIPKLARTAKTTLQQLGFTNVSVKIGDGYLGWEQRAPFDAILVTAATPTVPQPLLSQLKPDGVMVIPVGPLNGTQHLRVIRKAANDKLTTQDIIPVRFVPLTRQKD